MERIVDIGEIGSRLRVSEGRLAIERKDGSQTYVALRDIAVLLLSVNGLSLTGAVLSDLAEQGTPVVVCNRTRMPVGVHLPIVGHTRQTAILKGQIALKDWVRDKLWQQLVQAKILAQAATLKRSGLDCGVLTALTGKVKRGDPENIEGRAAWRYWRALDLFPVRDRSANDANVLLNYVYTALYGSTVRALCAAGLNTSLGLKHCHPCNPHGLASDAMEPFRPVADGVVRAWLSGHPGDWSLSSECRAFLLSGLLNTWWRTARGTVGFFAALTSLAVSLREGILLNSATVDIPSLSTGACLDVDSCAV